MFLTLSLVTLAVAGVQQTETKIEFAGTLNGVCIFFLNRQMRPIVVGIVCL